MDPRRSDERALLRRCRLLVRKLEEAVEVPSPFDLAAFLERLSRHRDGRQITLLPLRAGDLPPGTCGLLLALGNQDVIGFPADLPRNHRDHIVLHEVGHLLAGHLGGTPAGPALSRLLPDLDPGMVRAMLGRSAYNRREEHEAELIASLIMQRTLGGAPPATGTGGTDDVVLERLVRTLGAADASRR